MPRPTIFDIAELAGVSPSTVSNALNGRGRIAEDTRALVLDIAEREGYVPNAAAKSLREGSARFIGVLLPSLQDEFHAAVLAEFERAVAGAGYLCCVRTTGGDAVAQAGAVRALLQRAVSGIAVVGGNVALPEQQTHVPTVLVDRETEREPLPSVGNDLRGLVRTAAGTLFSRGRTRVALLSAERYSLVSSGSLRYQGYIEALDDASLPLARELVIEAPGAEDAAAAARSALATRIGLGVAIDAVVATTDEAAIGALCALAERGMAPGSDVAVIGMGNTRVAGLVRPSLSSVERHPKEMGRAAAELLLSCIAEPSAVPANVTVPFELVERDSTLGVLD